MYEECLSTNFFLNVLVIQGLDSYFLCKQDGFYIEFEIFADDINQFIDIFGVMNEKVPTIQIKANIQLVKIIRYLGCWNFWGWLSF